MESEQDVEVIPVHNYKYRNFRMFRFSIHVLPTVHSQRGRFPTAEILYETSPSGTIPLT